MGSEELHQIVNKAIHACRRDKGRYYHLCWWKERLRCLPTLHTKDPHPIFFMAPGEIFAVGLSEHQWRLIDCRLQDFCKERKIELTAVSSAGARRAGTEVAHGRLQVTEFDFFRLRVLLATARQPETLLDGQMKQLQEVLEQAEIVAPQDVSSDVVTMNSKVRLRDSRSQEDMVVTLVFPRDVESDTAAGPLRASILTPIGLSVFGHRVGDEIEGKIRVDELLFQPEAAGNFDL